MHADIFVKMRKVDENGVVIDKESFPLSVRDFDNMSKEELVSYISESRDDNIYAITRLLRMGVSIEELHDITKITNLSVSVYSDNLNLPLNTFPSIVKTAGTRANMSL